MPSILVLPATTNGRPPRFDGPLTPQRRGLEAYKAYYRAVAMAQNPKLQESNPRLVAEIDRWLYEIHHGKPRIQLDQRVNVNVVVYTPDDLLRAGAMVALAEDVQQQQIDLGAVVDGEVTSEASVVEPRATEPTEQSQAQTEATLELPHIKEDSPVESSPIQPDQSAQPGSDIRAIMAKSLAHIGSNDVPSLP